MQAIVYRQYGSPTVLRVEEIPRPVPADRQVLIQVRAAALNPLDWHYLRGIPYLLRLQCGLRQPKDPCRLGVDVAGRVAAVGSNVSRFRPGDAVFGACKGALAEYACATETDLAGKPDTVTFDEAAAVPVAAFTALVGLRDLGQLQPGQSVLINGAAGGVGTLAVQLAKWFGGEVTGVCSTRNLDLIRSLGADRVIDYTREDLATSGRRYDLFFDGVGNLPLPACRHLLQPRGIYLQIGASTGRWIAPLPRVIRALVTSRLVSQKLVLVQAKRSQQDLALMADLLASGKVKAVIDRRYRLPETTAAFDHLEGGHARGKVLVTMDGGGEDAP